MGWNTSVVSVRAVNQISQSDLSSKLPRSHLSEIGLESQQLDRSPNSSGSLTILESLKKKKVCWFFLFCYSLKWMGWSHRSVRRSEKEPMVGKVVVEGVALPVPASTHPSIVFNAAIQVVNMGHTSGDKPVASSLRMYALWWKFLWNFLSVKNF